MDTPVTSTPENPLAHALARESPKCHEIDPDLQRIFNAWPDLPPALKTGILAMIDNVQRG
jgi:hypothetical protein